MVVIGIRNQGRLQRSSCLGRLVQLPLVEEMIRWNQNTDVPVWRRFEKLSKQLDWDLQGKFEHVPESVLAGPGYLDAVVSILDGLAGEKDASEKRRVVRAALFEGQRKKEETLSQFAVRREQEFAGADRYLSIPSELKAFIPGGASAPWSHTARSWKLCRATTTVWVRAA